jgi:hypothetical protein
MDTILEYRGITKILKGHATNTTERRCYIRGYKWNKNIKRTM